MTSKIHIVNQKVRTISIPNGIDVIEELIADEGYKLIQSSENVENRIICSAVMLGAGHTKEEWIEITEEEASKYQN